MSTLTHTSSGPASRSEINQLRDAKVSTRLAFFIAGFGLACWAPLVPYAQQRLHADTATLGSVLLCLGLGAVIGMPLAGVMSHKTGTKAVIVAGAIALILSLPLMAFLSSPLTLGLALLVFGLATGAIDVAANIHGNEVQKLAGTPLMSGFHGLYSVGGLVGASGTTAIIAAGSSPVVAAGMASAVILLCIFVAKRGFLHSQADDNQPAFVFPRGRVVIVGVMAMIIFLAEGAMLDWSAILLSKIKGVDVSVAGAGYVIFAVAMTVSRLIGDAVVQRVGQRNMVIAGMVLTAGGILVAGYSSTLPVIFAAIGIAGLAAGNLVPVFFTLSTTQGSMPAAQAITATGILGYFGVLVGPALIGYTAHFTGLVAAFGILGLVTLAALSVVPAIKFRSPSE